MAEAKVSSPEESFWTSRYFSDRNIDVVRSNLGYMEIVPPESLKNDGWNTWMVFAVKSFGLPNFSFEEIEVLYGNDKSSIAGKVEIGDIEVTFIDLITKPKSDIGPVKMMNQWQNEIYNFDERHMGSPSRYIASATLYQLNTDGSILRGWKLTNIWPKTVAYGTIEMGESGMIDVAVTFSVDFIRICKDSELKRKK